MTCAKRSPQVNLMREAKRSTNRDFKIKLEIDDRSKAK